MEDDPESDITRVVVPGKFPIKITKWKVRKGTTVSKGVVLALYSVIHADDAQTNVKLKSTESGIVHTIDIAESEEAKPGSVLLTVGNLSAEPCTHPTVMKDMCALCGADLRNELGLSGDRKESVSASVAMVHSIPELIISEQEALELGHEDEDRLLRTRKLVLLVDLDQTLVHTTNDNIPPNLKDVSHFQLPHGPALLWYHTRFRPNTRQFLATISKMYELHICTFGVRLYAHTIARLLDPEEKFFSQRILSRDECFNAMSKTANLKALFPCGDSMVCIIDDREDVWNFSPNLIHVKPYRFFQGTADINAPPGLTKMENDDIPLTHRVRRVSESEEHHNTTSDSEDIVVEEEENGKGGKISKDIKMKEIDKLKNGPTSVKNEEKMDIGSDSNDLEIKKANQTVVKEEDCNDGDNKTIQKVDCSESDGKTDDKDSEVKKSSRASSLESDGKETENNEIEWDDDDDYLFHLEEILTRIHKAYYDLYDQTKKMDSEKKLPNLKDIVPYVRRKVLKGINIVFSGVVPLNMHPEKSQAYVIGRSLGATIQTSIVPRRKDNRAEATTHVVAAKPGTCKVNTALKTKGVQLVNVNWLWSCAERWDRVEEVLFPLEEGSAHYNAGPWGQRTEKNIETLNSSAVKRKSDDMFDNTTEPLESITKKSKLEDDGDVFGANGDEHKAGPSTTCTASKKFSFATSYNPLFSFSDADIEFMDKEVEDAVEEEEGSDSEAEEDLDREARVRKSVLGDVSDSSTEESLAGDFPRGWNLQKLSPTRTSDDERVKTTAVGEESENELEKYEQTVKAFSPDHSLSSESGDSIGSVDDEIADAVEKEFLSLL